MSHAKDFKIIICGAGIAGLSAAIALRAEGRHITILERSSLAREIGATISLQPNASRIVQKEWNIDSLKEANGTVDQGFRIFNESGDLVNKVALTAKTEYDGDRVCYHRQDLHACLLRTATSTERAGRPAELKTSSKVVSCDCEQGVVTLESGEQMTADLIVAADGIHSDLRKLVIDGDAAPIPTGFSAYRLMVPNAVLEENASEFCSKIKPREPFTSMIVAHSCRLIMGSARQGELFSLVGLVPDERMNEDPGQHQSWVSKGDVNRMLETYKDFPEWIKDVFRQGLKPEYELGLWQLRDLDPLKTWTKGRMILIGDAAHAMLPTQGQGASQAVEDAEALGAFFDEFTEAPSAEQVKDTLQRVFECRYERASLIQKYSRESSKPAVEKGTVTL